MHGRRMMREVVEHRHATRDAHCFETPLDPPEASQTLSQCCRVQAGVSADGDSGQGVADVVQPKQRRGKCPEQRAAAPHREVRHTVTVGDICGLPVEPVTGPVGLHWADGHRPQCGGIRAVSAEQQQPIAWHQIGQAAERQADVIDRRVDVGVVELNVVDDGNAGQVLEELGRLVEVGAVVLVPLDDEVPAMANPVAGAVVAEIERDAADEHRGVEPAVGQQPTGQRRHGGLAMRPRQHDRIGSPQKFVPHSLRQRAVPNLPLEHGFQFRVAAGNRIADDDQIDVFGNVVGRVAGHRADALSREKGAHRRVDVLVRPAHVMTARSEQGGQRRHRRAAHANQVDPTHITQQATPRQRATDVHRL